MEPIIKPLPEGFREVKDPTSYRTFISKEELDRKVGELANRIVDGTNCDEPLICIALLNGAMVFAVDLMRKMEALVDCPPLILETMDASSYSGEESKGSVHCFSNFRHTLEDYDLLVIEDIIDTGLTMTTVMKHLRTFRPRSIRICTLLDKPSRRQDDCLDFPPPIVGFEVPDIFVVGYGLDYDGLFRMENSLRCGKKLQYCERCKRGGPPLYTHDRLTRYYCRACVDALQETPVALEELEVIDAD